MGSFMQENGSGVPRASFVGLGSRARAGAGSRRSTAFLVEMVVIVAFLAVSVAVLTGVFAGAAVKGERSDNLSVALTLASTGAENGAEAFAANPTAPCPETTYYEQREGALVQVDQPGESTFVVTRTVHTQPTEAGTLYQATISVVQRGEEIYALETARYVSERGGL